MHSNTNLFQTCVLLNLKLVKGIKLYVHEKNVPENIFILILNTSDCEPIINCVLLKCLCTLNQALNNSPHANPKLS